MNTSDHRIEAIGEPLEHSQNRADAPERSGCVAVFPIRDDGTEMNWGLTPESLSALHAKGYVRVGSATPAKPQKYQISYLTSGRVADIESGRATIVGREPTGAVIAEYVTHKVRMPTTNWSRPSHNAEVGGTNMIKALLGSKRFDYPKSLYAVEDALRFFIGDNPTALVLDFFAGSGTTAHALMRLNRRDGGRRQSISVTNNEVSAQEEARLRERALRAGDTDWEARGICEFIAKPRITAAVTGITPRGEPIDGTYKFVDEFPMAEGFEENVEFLRLTYEAPRPVAHNRAFEAIAPLLWMKAGSQGRRIDKAHDDFAVVDTYGILFDLDHSQDFLAEVRKSESVRMAFVVTDDDRAYQMVCRDLPDRVEPVRLYESYLTNFTINTARD